MLKQAVFSAAQQDLTFLSVVRTDPSQITQILNQSFAEAEQRVKAGEQAEKKIVETQFKQYIDQCKQFMFGQINHQMAAEALKQSNEAGKGVCAKTLSHGDVAWKCETCEKDPTCIICQECFEKGDHKGHRVWLKRNVSGCCDCGDSSAWNESGFCSKHKGYSSETLLELLPPFIKKATKFVTLQVAWQLKLACLKLEKEVDQAKSYKGIMLQGKQSAEKLSQIITILFEFMDWSVEVSPAFIHFWTEALNQSFLFEIKASAEILGLKAQSGGKEVKPFHVCCAKSFSSPEDRAAFSQTMLKLILEEDGSDSVLLSKDHEPYVLVGGGSSNHSPQKQQLQQQDKAFNEKDLVEIRKAKGVCTCSVMDLTFQVNHVMLGKCKKLQYELYFKMFQSYKFKEILGVAFAANFEVISLQRESKDTAIGSIGVQILTIDEISLMIIQDENLRTVMTETLAQAVDNLVESDFSDHDQTILIHILYDLKYMTRQKTLKFAVEQTDLIEKLVEQLGKLYYHDQMEYRTEHIMFDASLYKEGLYNIDIFIIKVYKSFLRALDFTDVERNKRLLAHFIVLFDDINDKMPCSGREGFFATPLHRIFSYYFTRLIMQNYLKDQATYPGKAAKDIFVEIARRFFPAPQGQNQLAYIQKVLRQIIRPAAASWVFTHEILSGKWVMSGIYVNQLPKMLYGIFAYYVLMGLSLFQMLLVVSPEPAKTIDVIIGAFTCDVWMRTLHTKCIRGELNIAALEKDFSQHRPLFDPKKLRTMIHWELRLLIQLAVCELPYLYPLLTNLSRKETLTFAVQDLCNPQIEGAFRADMRRNIVHALILAGGRSDIKGLKQLLQADDIYVKSEHFEEELLQVATQHREGSAGKVLFKLKEEAYLQWFEPYLYLVPDHHAKQQEVMQSVQSFSEKKMINEVLGDFQDSYKHVTGVNSVIKCYGLGSSASLTKFVCSLITIWATQQQSEFRVVDDQVGSECLKILLIIAKGQGQKQVMDPFFIRCIKDTEYLSVMSLKIIGQQAGAGTVMEKAIKEVMKVIYELDTSEFNLIGDILGLTDAQDESPQEKEQNELRATSSGEQADLKKQMQAKRKEEILKQFQKKRQGFTSKTQPATGDESFRSTPALSRQSSSMAQTDEDVDNALPEDSECSLCRETLSLENFYLHPFGQFAYVSKSKLLSHAYRQALERGKAEALSPSANVKQEEEKKSSYVEEEKKESEEALPPPPLDPLDHVSINCLNAQGTGATLIKCSHYSHFKCLTEYLTSNESDTRKREMRKIIGLDFSTFQCPLCKHTANVLLPCGTLGDGLVSLIPKEKAYETLEFQTRLLSKIKGYQDGTVGEFLPVDIRKKPEQLLKSIQKFIEHKIQLLDVKGIHDFLKKSSGHKPSSVGGEGSTRIHAHNRVAKEQYADIMEITRNVMGLVLSGEIPVGSNAGEDIDMTEHTLPSLCLDSIEQVLQQNKGWKLLEADFSSLSLQLMFYTTLCMGFDDLEKLDRALNLIVGKVFSLFRIQTLLKGLFSRQTSHKLIGKPSELFELMKNRLRLIGVLKSSDYESKQFVEQFIIPSQLAYLRKVACFKNLVHTAYRRYKVLKLQRSPFISLEDSIKQEEDLQGFKTVDDDFIHRLTAMFDDNEEHHLLTGYLQIPSEGDLHQEPIVDNSDLPEELLDVLSFFSNPEQQDKILESYALSKIIQNLNPELILGDENLPIIKDQAMASDQIITIDLPARFQLLQSNLRFKLLDLPQDFQTLVQTYYKRKCRGCGNQPKESCVCLQCGEVVCFLRDCCKNLPGMKPSEGELSYHARMCEGGNAIYLSTSNGAIILIEEERSSQRPSPYVNKFGETFSQRSKKWDNFHLQNSSAGGAINYYEDIRRMYLNFSITNEVIKDRSISDVVWRLRAV